MKLIPYLLLLCCFFQYHAKAQDTLFFKNAGTLVVSVKEISPTDIQYKKFEAPDGPMYIVGRGDVEKIVYKNGVTEKLDPPVATNTVKTQEYPIASSSLVYVGKIEYADTKRRSSSLINMALGHPDPKKKNALFNLAGDIKKLKIHQDGTRTGAITFGGFAVAGGIIYTAAYTLSGGTDDLEVFAIPPIIFGTAGIILGAASISFNINLKQKRHEFVRIYNE